MGVHQGHSHGYGSGRGSNNGGSGGGGGGVGHAGPPRRGGGAQLLRARHKQLLAAIRSRDSSALQTALSNGSGGGGGGGSSSGAAAAAEAAAAVLLTVSRSRGSSLHAAAASGDGGAALGVLLGATRGEGATALDGESGWTPLHVALYGCHLRAAAVLLRAGAGGGASLLRLRDAGGAAPLDVVARPGDELPAARGHPGKLAIGAGSSRDNRGSLFTAAAAAAKAATAAAPLPLWGAPAGGGPVGELWVWGSNGSFQLGVGAAAVDLAPRLLCVAADELDGEGGVGDNTILADGGDVYTDVDVAGVATADQHSLLLDAAGGVWSVGVGHGGRLGHGDTRTRPIAARVAGLRGVGVVAVAASRRRSAAVSVNGDLYMWGGDAAGDDAGSGGIRGRGDVLDADAGGSSLLPRPVTAGGLRSVAVVSVALADGFTLAVDARGAVWGWGDNTTGALALDPGVPWVGTPRQLPAFAELRAAAVYTAADGCGACAALLMDGGVMVWGGEGGRRKPRRLGLAPLFPMGVHVHRPSPPPVAVAVAVAAAGVALVTDSGRVYAWRPAKSPGSGGSSGSGASSGGVGTYTAVPLAAGVPGGRVAVGVAAAGEQLLVIDALGAVYRLPWTAAVQAGGARGSRRPPGWAADPIPTVRGVVAVAAGRHHALCVVAPRSGSEGGGAAVARGLRSSARLGSGTYAHRGGFGGRWGTATDYEEEDSSDDEDAPAAVAPAAATPTLDAPVASGGHGATAGEWASRTVGANDGEGDIGTDDRSVPTLQRLCEAAVLSELRLSTAAELLEMADTLGLGGLRRTCLAFFGANADILLATRGASAIDSLHDTTLDALEASMRTARGLPPLPPPPPLVPFSPLPTPSAGVSSSSSSTAATAAAAVAVAAATVAASSEEAAEAIAMGGTAGVQAPPLPPASLGAVAVADAAARRLRALRKKLASTLRLADRAAAGAVLSPAEAVKLASRPALELALAAAVGAAADAAEAVAEAEGRAVSPPAADTITSPRSVGGGASVSTRTASVTAPGGRLSSVPAVASPLVRGGPQMGATAATAASSADGTGSTSSSWPRPAPATPVLPPTPWRAPLTAVASDGLPPTTAAAATPPRSTLPTTPGVGTPAWGGSPSPSAAASFPRLATNPVEAATSPSPTPSPATSADSPLTARRRPRAGRARPVLVMGALSVGGTAAATAAGADAVAVGAAPVDTTPPRGWSGGTLVGATTAGRSPATTAAAATAAAPAATAAAAGGQWLTPLPAPAACSLAGIQLQQQAATAGRRRATAGGGDGSGAPAADPAGSGGVALTALLRSSPRAINHRRGGRAGGAVPDGGGGCGSSPTSTAGASAWGAGTSPVAIAWSPPHAPLSPETPSSRRPAAATTVDATDASRRSFRAIQEEEEAARRRGLGRLATDRLGGRSSGGGGGGGNALDRGVPVGGPPPAGRWFRPEPPACKPLRVIEAEERAMEALRRAHPEGVVIRRA